MGQDQDGPRASPSLVRFSDPRLKSDHGPRGSPESEELPHGLRFTGCMADHSDSASRRQA